MAATYRPTPIRLSASLEEQVADKAHSIKVSKAELVRRYVEMGLGIDFMGPVETKTRADVEALVSKHPMGEALAAIAFRLAREIDFGNPFALAGLSKELRGVLAELAQDEESDDDDDLFASILDGEDDQ